MDIWDALMKWLRSDEQDKQPATQGVAEEVNKALPEALSAHSAIEADRKRKKQIDDLFAEN